MKKTLLLILLFALTAYGQLDPTRNFGKVTVKYGYAKGATTIILAAGHGSKLPPTSEGYYNLVWWNSYRYGDPSDDPFKEIIRVILLSGDTLKTVLRGQEGTVDTNHNALNQTYRMILPITKKTIDDIREMMKVDESYHSIYADTAIYARNGGGGASDSVLYATNSGFAAYSGYATTSGTSALATTATYATTAGGAPPTGAASGMLKDFFPSPSIASNVLTAAMIRSSEVVKSIFGLKDDVAMKGSGGTSLSVIDGGTDPDTIVIASIDTAGGGGGISTIGSTGTISVTNPAGPTTTLDVASNSLTATHIVAGAIGTSEILNGTILTEDFNETAIAPYASYATTAGGAPPTGTATGGNITGTFPNSLGIAANGINASSQITDGVIQSQDIRDTTIQTGDLKDALITTPKFAPTAKAPLATYADSAGKSNPSGPAGGVLGGAFPIYLTLNPNVVGTSQLINQSVTQAKIDSNILVPVTAVPNMVLYALISAGDTNIASTTTPISMFDSLGGLYFITNYAAQNASRLSRGTVAGTLLENSGVSAGTYNWGTVNAKGIVTSANNISGGGGSGGGLSNVIVDSFATTATKDTISIAGAKSYDFYSVTPMMKTVDEAWSANDGLRVFADSGRAIVLRNSNGTSGAWYSLGRQAKELAMATNVDVTSLSSTSLRVSWTDPLHSQSFSAFTTDSVGICYRTVQYDSVFPVATNKRYKKMGVGADTITGLSASTLYYICVFPWTTRNESDTALTPNRDTCTTGAGAGGEPFFNAKDSLGNLQVWNSVRFLGSKSNLDVIEATELYDSSGNHRVFAYGTQTNTQKARYLSNQVNSIGAIALAYRDSGGTRDTCAITCDALGPYISANAENKPFTLVLVAKTVQGAVGGYNAWQHIWSTDIDGSTSNWGGGRFYTAAPTTIGYRRMVAGTDHSYDPATGSESVYNYHVWEWIFDGDNVTIYCDSNIIGVETAMNYDTHQADMFTLGGCRYLLAGVTDYCALRYTEFLFMNKEASAYERSYYNKWLKSIYAIQ